MSLIISVYKSTSSDIKSSWHPFRKDPKRSSSHPMVAFLTTFPETYHTLSYRHAVHRRSTTFSVVTFAEAGTCGIRTHLPWAATDAIWMTMRTTVHNFAAIFQQEKQSSPCDEAVSSGPLSHRSVAACRLQWPEPRRNNFRRGWKASVRWTWERAISAEETKVEWRRKYIARH